MTRNGFISVVDFCHGTVFFSQNSTQSVYLFTSAEIIMEFQIVFLMSIYQYFNAIDRTPHFFIANP